MEHKDILSFNNGLDHMPTVANRAADILVKMFNLVDSWGWRPARTNPARGTQRFSVEKREWCLTLALALTTARVLHAYPGVTAQCGPVPT